MKRRLFAAAAAFALASLSGAAWADVDPSQLYELSTQGSTAKLHPGDKGKWVLVIQPKAGAHVSDDAPMKIELSGSKVKLDKTQLARADAALGAIPRFEVGFSAAEVGKASIDARMSFFICTDKVCAKQQRTVSVPVEVQ